jgi:hypothetical protein
MNRKRAVNYDAVVYWVTVNASLSLLKQGLISDYCKNTTQMCHIL